MFSLSLVRLRRLRRLEYYVRLVRVAGSQLSGGVKLRRAIRAVTIFRNEGLRGLPAALRRAASRHDDRANSRQDDYGTWIATHDTLTDSYISALRNELANLTGQPLISVLMPVYNTPEQFLRAAIDSVLNQIYENWELCVADDSSTEPTVQAVLNEYAERDPRIKVVFRTNNKHVSRASNSALELVTGEWIALLDHDDILRPHALAEVVG